MAQCLSLPVFSVVYRHNIRVAVNATRTKVLTVFTGDLDGSFYVLKMSLAWVPNDMIGRSKGVRIERGVKMDTDCPLYYMSPDKAQYLHHEGIVAFWEAINKKQI